MSFRDEMHESMAQWDGHKFKCPICRRHVSIDGLILREKQLCSKGRQLAKAAWSMAEAGANMGIE